MNYNAKLQWSNTFKNRQMAYPAEYVIRIFKGEYPNLNLKKNTYIGKKICDMGFGDGRHLPLFNDLGFALHGVEIAKDLVELVRYNLAEKNITNIDLRVGTNDNIPFEDDFFDYLLSWNVCYYMGKNRDFNLHVKELARVLKPDGYLILSIPKKTHFLYRNSNVLIKGYQQIKDDPFNVRNGEILRMFDDETELVKEFSNYFKNFSFGSIEDNCFGFNYHMYLVVCQKK